MLENIVDFDKRITLRLNRYKNEKLTPIIKFFAFFGQEPFWFLIIAFYVFIWYDPNGFVMFGGSFLAGMFLVVPTKFIINRKRPFQQLDEIIFLDVPQLSASFPSWHAYNIVVMSCASLYFWQSIILAPVLIMFVFMVCFSRIYLGSHYFLDVITGFLLGFIGFIINIASMPFWLSVITHFEQFSPWPVIHQYWVTMIITQWWYLILVILVYFGIFLNAYYSVVIKAKKKSKE